MREDENLLSPKVLTVRELRQVLSKYGVELPTEATNKSFLVKQYEDNHIDQLIRTRWEEDARRSVVKRPRTIELVDQVPARKARKYSSLSSPQGTAQSEEVTLSDLMAQYLSDEELLTESEPVAVETPPRQSSKLGKPHVVGKTPPSAVKTNAPRRSTVSPSGKALKSRIAPVPVPAPVAVPVPARSPIRAPVQATSPPKVKLEAPIPLAAQVVERQGRSPARKMVQQPTKLARLTVEKVQSRAAEEARQRRIKAEEEEEEEDEDYEDQNEEEEEEEEEDESVSIRLANSRRHKRGESVFTSLFTILIALIILAIAMAVGFHLYANRHLPFCGTGRVEEAGVCVACPFHGQCAPMSYVCECPVGYLVSKDQHSCILDGNIPLLADRLLTEVLKPALRLRKGNHICGSSSQAEMAEDEVESLLRVEYAKMAPQDASLSDFHYVKMHVQSLFETNQIYVQPSSQLTPKARLGTNDDPIMTVSCSLRLFFAAYALVIVPLSLGLLYTVWRYILYRRKLEVICDIHYSLREAAQKDPAAPGLPVASLREEFCSYSSSYSLNYLVWKAVEEAIALDNHVVDTSQLVGGEQKLMWEWEE